MFALLLVAVQLYVLRAMLRIIRSMQLIPRKEKSLIAAAVALLVIVNVPLVFFIVEGLVTPRRLLLYAPPSAYESTIRPFCLHVLRMDNRFVVLCGGGSDSDGLFCRRPVLQA